MSREEVDLGRVVGQVEVEVEEVCWVIVEGQIVVSEVKIDSWFEGVCWVEVGQVVWVVGWVEVEVEEVCWVIVKSWIVVSEVEIDG